MASSDSVPPGAATLGAGLRQHQVVQFTGPGQVEVVDSAPEPLPPTGHVRVRTLYSGVSAGTELTAYRGSNPYLSKRWDPGRRLFVQGDSTFAYPVVGWGYSEVGRVVERSPEQEDSRDGDDAAAAPMPEVGDLVYGIWGHRSEAVLPARSLTGHQLPTGVEPVAGVFARVGAIALNAVLAAEVHLGETVAVFGQGVIGLLVTQLTALSGGTVAAVDTLPARLDAAARSGASVTIDASTGQVAERVRELTGNRGADVAIEISGSYAALHEAVRATAVGGRVVAAGFYQGGATGLVLGEEFHHNRISICSSQIGSVPEHLRSRWSVERLQRTVMTLIASGRLDVSALLSRIVPVGEAASVYRMLDEDPGQTLQVVLDFTSDDPSSPR